MLIENEVSIAAPIAVVWARLVDVPAVAGSLPGARVEEVAPNEFEGTMSVKLGPIRSTYQGTIELVGVDDNAHEAHLLVKARELRGQGSANATVRNSLQAVGPASTRLKIATELEISGRAAQFGRGLLQDVASGMLKQFAANLEQSLTGATPSTPAEAHVEAPAGELDAGGVALALARSRWRELLAAGAVALLVAWGLRSRRQ